MKVTQISNETGLKLRGYEKAITLSLFLVPFFLTFQNAVEHYTFIPNYLNQYIPFLAIVVSLLLRSKSIFIDKKLGLVFFYASICLVWSSDYVTGLLWVFNLFIGLLLGGLLHRYKMNVRCLLGFVYGVILCNIVLLPEVISKFPFSFTRYMTGGIPFYDGDVSVGPNGWGQVLVLAEIALMVVYNSGYEKKKFWVMTVIICYFCFLTQSRTSIYFVAFLLVANYWLRSVKIVKSKIVIWKYIFVIAVAFAAVFIVIYLGEHYGAERITQSNNFGHRTGIWLAAVDVYLNKMNLFQKMFGCGTGASGKTILKYWNYSYVVDIDFSVGADHISVHSTYLSTLLNLGLIGFIMYMGYWISAIIKLFRSRLWPYLMYALMVLVMGVTYHMFENSTYVITLSLTQYALLRTLSESS